MKANKVSPFIFIYYFKHFKDVLMIAFDFYLEVNKTIKKDHIILLYHDDTLVGINLLNINAIIKIFYEGVFINPPKPVINIINNILTNHDMLNLDVDYYANIKCGLVVDEYKVKYKNQLFGVDVNLKNYLNKYVIFTLNECILYNLKKVGKGHVCKENEIQISKRDTIYYQDNILNIDKIYY